MKSKDGRAERAILDCFARARNDGFRWKMAAKPTMPPFTRLPCRDEGLPVTRTLRTVADDIARPCIMRCSGRRGSRVDWVGSDNGDGTWGRGVVQCERALHPTA